MNAPRTAAAQEITLIQIGRSELRLDDDTYRTMLANLCGGKTSSKALSAAERQTVLTHMKSRGFVIKPKALKHSAGETWHREPQLRKLRAMWWTLADAGHVERPADAAACTAAVEAWAMRHLASGGKQHLAPLAAIRFASGPQMNELVEGMKKWLQRLRLPTE